ncbi:hypothetical protein QP127_13565 [Citrobacter freundii]|nr:hypothetical protein [Citrobacter freundii]MDK6380908.1 hypothetical protein [Citrobacter freundii]
MALALAEGELGVIPEQAALAIGELADATSSALQRSLPPARR